MSNAFYVGPSERIQWGLETDEFKQLLLSDWPTVTNIEQPTTGKTRPKLSWELPYGDGFIIECSLFGSTIVLDGGDLEETAKFAIWYRRIIPPEIMCFFYYDADSPQDTIKLSATSTEENILDPSKQSLVSDDDIEKYL